MAKYICIYRLEYSCCCKSKLFFFFFCCDRKEQNGNLLDELNRQRAERASRLVEAAAVTHKIENKNKKTEIS